MKRLVQKIEEINPMLIMDKGRLQDYFDKKSSEGWEYCGQLGLFHLFKRWEEVPNVVEGGRPNTSYFSSNPYGGGYGGYQYGYGYGQQYQQQSPYYRPQQQTPYYSPSVSQFGTRVDPASNTSPSEDD